MNKKERKVFVRHDGHVVNNNLKTIVDDEKTELLEESEQLLYGKKTNIRQTKGNGQKRR
jgi:hypothetical protein